MAGDIADGGSMKSLPGDPLEVPAAKTKCDVDPMLRKQLTSLQKQADDEQKARLQGTQAKHMMPEKGDWNGSLFDYEGMAKPFDRKQSNDWFDEATKDASNPGTVADLILTTTQIDMLACMERAFRSRHTSTRVRNMCHAMGRKYGHGHDRGPLRQAILEAITGTVKEAKGSGVQGGDK